MGLDTPSHREVKVGLLCGYFLLRELDPLCSRSAAIIPVQARMCPQDLDAAANEQSNEQEIDVVTETQLEGKSQACQYKSCHGPFLSCKRNYASYALLR